jgi:hypothetical protein
MTIRRMMAASLSDADVDPSPKYINKITTIARSEPEEHQASSEHTKASFREASRVCGERRWSASYRHHEMPHVVPTPVCAVDVVHRTATCRET